MISANVLSPKLRVSKKDINVKAFNLITNKNEASANSMVQHVIPNVKIKISAKYITAGI